MVAEHALPVTGVTYVAPTSCLATAEQRAKFGEEYKKVVNREIDDEGWVVSSSVDYTVSVRPMARASRREEGCEG